MDTGGFDLEGGQPSSGATKVQRSRYNYFVDRPDGLIMGYNARTGTFAILAADVADRLRSDGPLEGVRDAEQLIRMGFLHAGDEFDQIIARYNQRSQPRILNLTLTPTLDCNFSCDYCRQSRDRGRREMSPAVQEATLRFVDARVREGRQSVVIEWYGGEPLLVKHIVLNMTLRLRAVLRSADVSLAQISIITNGTLLDAATARSLAEAGIASAYVSFDSLSFEPGVRRGVLMPNGDPSPILRNLLRASQHIRISIRINVSASNALEIPKITEALDNNGFSNQYHFARVNDFETGTAPVRTITNGRTVARALRTSLPIVQPGGKSLTCDAFAQLERQAVFAHPELLAQAAARLSPRSHYCSATSGAAFVIDPDGFISRCWECVGFPSRAVGNVLHMDGSIEASETAKRWRDHNPLASPPCASCRVLPLCMGGCSYPRLFMDVPDQPCEAIKYQIEEFVREVGSHLVVTQEQTAAIAFSDGSSGLGDSPRRGAVPG